MLSEFFARHFATVKCKTNQAASKRFRRLASGAYTFYKSGRNHNFAHKSIPRQTGIRQAGITEGFQTQLLDRMLPQ